MRDWFLNAALISPIRPESAVNITPANLNHNQQYDDKN